MRIHEVHIIPGAGHSGDDGRFSRGRIVNTTAEVDVVDRILPSFVEELDLENVRFRVMNTRAAPGIKLSERPRLVMPSDLVVSLGVGWNRREGRTTNGSMVWYGPGSQILAGMVADTLLDWGSCAVFGHRRNVPKQSPDPLMTVAGTEAILIEPFALNGPNVDDYLRRLDALGRDIARAVAEYLKGRGEASARQVATLW